MPTQQIAESFCHNPLNLIKTQKVRFSMMCKTFLPVRISKNIASHVKWLPFGWVWEKIVILTFCCLTLYTFDNAIVNLKSHV